jgi:arylsulfatase A-like enzyme
MWDPHTHYRTPEEFGNPFENDPIPSWVTEEKIKADYESYGPHSAHETLGYGIIETGLKHSPAEVKNLEDYKTWIDGYDIGIRYSDHYIGKILDILEEKGILDDTAIIVSSDHGENQGELNVYGDHQTADHITSRVPYILKWPGLEPRVYSGLHYQNDMAATMLELLGTEVPDFWDGVSAAEAVKKNEEDPRDYLVVSQNAWSCQRAVRFENYIMIKTYHTGLKHFPEYMLFDLAKDPHELNNIAQDNPELVDRAVRMLEKWHSDMMRTSTSDTDPMWVTIKEGGPLHGKASHLTDYCKRLRETDRAHHADLLEKLQGKPIDF